MITTPIATPAEGGRIGAFNGGIQGLMPQQAMPQQGLPQQGLPQQAMLQQGFMPQQGLDPRMGYAAQGGRIGYGHGDIVEEGDINPSTIENVSDRLDAYIKIVGPEFGPINELAKAYGDSEMVGFLLKFDQSELKLPMGAAQGGRIGFTGGTGGSTYQDFLADKTVRPHPDDKSWRDVFYRWLDQQKNKAQGGRIGAQEGGLMNLGGMEKDYRQEGGFVPIGGREKADDVPARLSKNEFVFTADAVRAAGGGDIDAGAEVMENIMENLEAGGEVSEESQGLEGARGMFANAQQLEKRII